MLHTIEEDLSEAGQWIKAYFKNNSYIKENNKRSCQRLLDTIKNLYFPKQITDAKNI